MTDKTNLEAVMRRIQKMLAIANDDRADPNEAAAAAVMAEKVMRKYQLEHSDIVLTSIKAGEDMVTEDHIATAKTNGTPVKNVPTWASWLAIAVGRTNDCGARIVRMADGQVGVRFYGYKGDVAVAGYTFDYLIATVNQLCNTFRMTSIIYKQQGRRAANSYRAGVAQGIVEQLRLARQAKEAEPATTAGTELVVVKRQALVDKWGDVFATKKTRSQVGRGDAFATGKQDGRQVDVNRRGVTGGTRQARLTGGA